MLCTSFMRSHKHSARVLLAVLAVISGILIALPAWAAFTVSAAETTRMDFGTIAKPASGSQYLDLSAANSALTGTGSKLFGTASRGVYTLTKKGGGAGTSMTLDISNVSTGSAALTFSNFIGIYQGITISSFPSSPQSLPATAPGTPFYLGVRETVTSAIGVGALSPTFDLVITIN